MNLQRRLVLAALVSTPLIWLLTIAATFWHTQQEINQLFDTEQIRLAQQMEAMIPAVTRVPFHVVPLAKGEKGAARLNELVIAVWDRDGTLLAFDDHKGVLLPAQTAKDGFVDMRLSNRSWRVFYQSSANGHWRIAVGQRLDERRELALGYILSQIVPWLLSLPILLLVMAGAIRYALRPVRDLSEALEDRSASDLAPLGSETVPDELKPLVNAMNRLFERVSQAMEQERRLTADAAHELRTPLAALRSQWEVAQRAPESQRPRVMEKVGLSIARLERLVRQLLALSRLEGASQPVFNEHADWHAIAEQALSDCLSLSAEKEVDVEFFWPDDDEVLPIQGNDNLLSLMLRNLLDNAIRHSPRGSCVSIVFQAQQILVEDAGPGVPDAVLTRLGDRFFRAPGQQETGSGLGLSIVRRVAQLHGVQVHFENRLNAGSVAGLRVILTRVN